MSDIYLDNNATTFLEPQVQDEVLKFMEQPQNPSSAHSFGRKARSIIESARLNIMGFANTKDSRVIFTSSGTEANNLALRGLVNYNLLVSAIEHPSVLNTGKSKGAIVFPSNKDGIINLEALERLLKQQKGKTLISVMLANNETGVIQPIKKVVEIAKRYRALVHTDAVQCFGKINVDMDDLGVDMLTISAHKFGGPQGAAALITKKHVLLSAQITGGGQEQNFRAGTENIAAIYGFGVAAKIAKENLAKTTKKTISLRNQLEEKIKELSPTAKIIGDNTQRLPNTSYITMPGVSSETQLIHFDLNGIAVSAGSACSSGKIEPSHVLKAMGIANNIANTVIRVSLSKNNTGKDIDIFIQAWKQLYDKINLQQRVA